jgi:hypothetical protein
MDLPRSSFLEETPKLVSAERRQTADLAQPLAIR